MTNARVVMIILILFFVCVCICMCTICVLIVSKTLLAVETLRVSQELGLTVISIELKFSCDNLIASL